MKPLTKKSPEDSAGAVFGWLRGYLGGLLSRGFEVWGLRVEGLGFRV